MKRPRLTWLVFGLAVVGVAAALAWATALGLRLERRAETDRRAAAREERVRLALWRMDSALTPLLARENSRPYFVYSTFYPENRAYTRMFSPLEPGEVLVPSPLLAFESPYVEIHFQIAPDGSVTSPQAPTGNMRDLAEGYYVSPEDIRRAEAKLGQLAEKLDRKRLLAELGQDPVRQPPVQTTVAAQHEKQKLMNQVALQARASQLEQAIEQNAPVTGKASDRRGQVREGPLRAVWVGDVLLTARRVQANGGAYVQGCRLDWAALQEWLLGQVEDLLPQARLEPLRGEEQPEDYSMLASLPVRLAPGEVGVAGRSGLSPVRLSLLVAWVFLFAAVAAIGFLLHGAISLSERRADFVSAVTHELRTPLTTFQMYSEMLADGIIRDDRRRQEYLDTLRSQAYRLGHLVENVLAFARLEKGRSRSEAERLSLGDLLGRIRSRLEEHAQRCGVVLEVNIPDDAAETPVAVDVSAVEQILFNLTDNACKYAARPTGTPIEIEAAVESREAVVSVRDHGPGIAPSEARRIFRPFHKSARDAANSAPGVGLGLALSRRLARDMGGDLRLESPDGPGSRFELRLALAN